MRARTAAFAVLAFTLSGTAAHAHEFVEGAGFLNGFLHPLFVPAHALCVAAFGLMVGQQNHPFSLSALFLAALIAGMLLIVFAIFPVDMIPIVLLASGAAAGLLTAAAYPLPWIIPAVVLAAGGSALIIDSVPSVVSKTDTILALAGTAFTATLAVAVLAYAAATLTRDWQRIGVRIVGSWAAASALLVLALRLVQQP
jgi:urease accessory protein